MDGTRGACKFRWHPMATSGDGASDHEVLLTRAMLMTMLAMNATLMLAMPAAVLAMAQTTC